MWVELGSMLGIPVASRAGVSSERTGRGRSHAPPSPRSPREGKEGAVQAEARQGCGYPGLGVGSQTVKGRLLCAGREWGRAVWTHPRDRVGCGRGKRCAWSMP